MCKHSLFELPSAPIWKVGSRRLVLCRPYIMGILNVTPDSFSDGGVHNGAEEAISFAQEMLEAGADIIDVGGESTRPGAAAVSIDEELSRVLPVVETLATLGVIVSIDTYHPEVAKRCIEAGASIINDISGFSNPEMVQVAASCNAGIIAMHMAGTPKNMQDDPRYSNATFEIKNYLCGVGAMLESAGVERSRICIDPGPGFGKNARHNLQLLEGMDELASCGYPVLAAFSRKSTLGKVTGQDVASKRVESSAAAAVLAYCGGARIFRVHDVAQTVEVLKVASNTAYAAHSQSEPTKPASGFSTMLDGKRVLVALGANMGEPVDSIIAATRALDQIPDTTVIASSSIYKTEPAYYTEQDQFANSVVWVQTKLSPNVLLQKLFDIENQFGRVRTIENGPRTLDLDILDYEGVVSTDPHLILPHPRILERDFAVTPIIELEEQMRNLLGDYVADDVYLELGNNAYESAESDGLGGFRLADGKRVTNDSVQYGTILERLVDADEVI